MRPHPEAGPSQQEQERPPKKWPLWFESETTQAMREHGELRTELWSKRMDPALRERLKDPLYLPSRAEVARIEDATEYSNELGDHEILNHEYVRALAEHLQFVARRIPHGEGKPLRVVEVGAGSGRLSYFLNEELKRAAYGGPPAVEVIATTPAPGEPDPNRDIPDMPVLAPVEFLLANEAIERYKPDLVIASWPTLDDLDRLVVDAPSVKELILIGMAEACHIRAGEDGWTPISGFSGRPLTEAEHVQTSRMDRPRSGKTESSTFIYQRADTFPVQTTSERVTLPDIPLPDFSPFGDSEHYRTATHAFPFPGRESDLTAAVEYEQFPDNENGRLGVRLSATDAHGTRALIFHSVVRGADQYSEHQLVPESGSDTRACVFTSDVMPEFRGQGLGHAGMQLMEEMRRRIGDAQPSTRARWIEIRTQIGSTAELASRLGFEPFPGFEKSAARLRTNGATTLETVPNGQDEVPFYKKIDPTVAFTHGRASL